MRTTLVLFVLLAACGGPQAGSRVARPVVAAPVASARASDPDGPRTFYNARIDAYGEAGLLATTPGELAVLWDEVGLTGRAPDVDFATYVVLGTNFEDGVCQPELVAAHVDVNGALVFEEHHEEAGCILLAVRVARVVAVPRRILPERFVWVHGSSGFAFTLPRR